MTAPPPPVSPLCTLPLRFGDRVTQGMCCYVGMPTLVSFPAPAKPFRDMQLKWWGERGGGELLSPPHLQCHLYALPNLVPPTPP